jgi:hypothetical protein
MQIRDFSEKELKRKERAERLMIAHYFENLTLADAWYRTTQATTLTCSRNAAKVSCKREIDWHRDHFKTDIDSMLIINRMDDHSVFAALQEIMYNATTTRREGPDGEYVVVPDNRIRLDAIGKWMLIRGFGGKKRPPVISLHPEHRAEAREAAAAEEKIVERDDSGRRDINDLPEYPLLGDEEWQEKRRKAEASSQPPAIIRKLMEQEKAPPGELVRPPQGENGAGRGVAPPADIGRREPVRLVSRGPYRVLEGPAVEAYPQRYDLNPYPWLSNDLPWWKPDPYRWWRK